MNKIVLLLLTLLLVSCGNDKTSALSSDEGRTAAGEKTAAVVSMQSILAGAEKGNYREGEIIVKLKPGVRTASSLGAQRALGGVVLRRLSLLNTDHVRLPQGVTVRDAIIRYMQDPDVEYAEPNYIRSARSAVPNDHFFSMQWELQDTQGANIKMPSAWDVVKENSGLVVAVLDSGVDYTHPDLAGNVWANPGEPSCTIVNDNDHNGYVADCRGWNFVSDNNNPMDDEGHGTHVSGTIGAAGNNNVGIAGIMWKVKIMPLKILDNNGNGTVADEVAGVQYAITKGAKIINASFSGDQFSNAEFDAIKAADAAGVLFVTAAGNGNSHEIGSNNDTVPVYPGNYNLPNIISVAATNQNDHISSFSNFGPTTVHVAAPGELILSTVPPGLSFTFCGGSSPLIGYGYCDGTSMAAPHVSGLAGLVTSCYPGLTPSQLRAMIMRYADVLPALQGVIRSGGRINAYKTVSALLGPFGLSADARSSTEIALTWNDRATGEDGYKIERAAPGGDFAQVAETGPQVTTFTDSGLNPVTPYKYRVRAFNTIPADSGYSNEASATTLSGTGPNPPPSSGGGGGGCSVAGKTHVPADGDVILVLMPIFAAVVLYRVRRKRK